MNRWIALSAALLLLTGCSTAPKDTLMQVSTIDALLAGAYDGQMTVKELRTHGDLGLGTFDALEGEMISIDGEIYQARADGSVRKMPDDAATPFAAMVAFSPDQTATLRGARSAQTLKDEIDRMAPNKNLFLAVRADGTFSSMKVRSVPKQKKPYPPLADAAKNQSVFEYTNVTGTVLGFRCPPYVKGINVPGYHLHFISDDKSRGGHILDFTVTEAELQLDACSRFLMILTEQEQFSTIDLSQDRSKELERVEK